MIGPLGNHTFLYNKQSFRLDSGNGMLVTIDNSVRFLNIISVEIARRFVDITPIFGIYERLPTFGGAITYRESFNYRQFYEIKSENVELIVEYAERDAVEFRIILRLGQGLAFAVTHLASMELMESTDDRFVVDFVSANLSRSAVSHMEQWTQQEGLARIGHNPIRDSELERAYQRTREYAPRENPEWWARVTGTATWDAPQAKENKKAKELLLSCLTKQQKKQYEKHNWFIVRGSETGLVYRINRKSQINVDLMDGDVVVKRLCTVPDEYVPIEDHLLAQKLMLETDEMDFLSRAIEWRAR